KIEAQLGAGAAKTTTACHLNAPCYDPHPERSKEHCDGTPSSFSPLQPRAAPLFSGLVHAAGVRGGGGKALVGTGRARPDVVPEDRQPLRSDGAHPLGAR